MYLKYQEKYLYYKNKNMKNKQLIGPQEAESIYNDV